MKIRCVGMVSENTDVLQVDMEKGIHFYLHNVFGFIIITFKTYNCEQHNSDNIKDKIIIASRLVCGGVR